MAKALLSQSGQELATRPRELIQTLLRAQESCTDRKVMDKRPSFIILTLLLYSRLYSWLDLHHQNILQFLTFLFLFPTPIYELKYPILN